MNWLGYSLIVLGAALLGMGLLSIRWKRRSWWQQFTTGLVLIAGGIYLLLRPGS